MAKSTAQQNRNQQEQNRDESRDENRNENSRKNRQNQENRQPVDFMQSASREISRETDNFMMPFINMQKQMNTMMENMFASMTDLWSAPADKMMPKVRVWEDRDAFHLKTRLPLDNPDNIEVAINDNLLTLRWHQDRHQNNGPHQFFSSHDAYRTIMIPENADPENARAICENGSLEVIVPKKENSENARRIPIQRSA